jgi:hypothetical protein
MREPEVAAGVGGTKTATVTRGEAAPFSPHLGIDGRDSSEHNSLKGRFGGLGLTPPGHLVLQLREYTASGALLAVGSRP